MHLLITDVSGLFFFLTKEQIVRKMLWAGKCFDEGI